MTDWVDAFNLLLERLDRIVEQLTRIADHLHTGPAKEEAE